MRNFFATHRNATRSLLLIVALVTIAVLLVGVVVALGVTGRRSNRAAAPTTLTAVSGALPSALAFGRPVLTPPSAAGSPTASRSTVPDVAVLAGNRLPGTADPVTFALAFARALFSYDTRSQTESAWTAALTAGLDATADVHLDNLTDLADRTPPAPVWSTMTSSAQYAGFTATRSWVPQLWTQDASAYPAGAVAITVSGTQHVVWAGGSSDVASSVTLLLVCPPLTSSCVVNRIPAQVLP